MQAEALGGGERGTGGEGSDGCSQSGRLASPIVAQEGGDEALVEVQAEPVQGRLWVTRKALFQAPYGDSWNQARGRLFHEHWGRRADSAMGAPGVLGAVQAGVWSRGLVGQGSVGVRGASGGLEN